MHFDKIKNKGQGQLFEKEYLESLTKSHPAIIYSMYLPLILFLVYYSRAYLELTWTSLILAFVAGVFTWTFVEYVLHRFVFHIISEKPNIQRFIYKIHGVHHEYPRDQERLFMPPLPSIFLAAFFLGLFFLLMGEYAFAFFPGFVSGYLAYGSMHFAIHAFKPPFFMKSLWRNHHLHHYKYPDKGFGVSSVLWDYVFGTMPPQK